MVSPSLSLNRRWYGVRPLGGCASPDRLKPELHAAGSSCSQCMRKSDRGLSMNRRKPRQVLECASPLALLNLASRRKKRQRTAAVQDAAARSAGKVLPTRRRQRLGAALTLVLFLAAGRTWAGRDTVTFHFAGQRASSRQSF